MTRPMWCWARGMHMPVPRLVDGRWRCHACGRRLTRYRDEHGAERLRHYWRDR